MADRLPHAPPGWYGYRHHECGAMLASDVVCDLPASHVTSDAPGCPTDPDHLVRHKGHDPSGNGGYIVFDGYGRVIERKERAGAPVVVGSATVPKPPLGVPPEYLWREQRLADIERAIAEREGTEHPIPPEWPAEAARHRMLLESKRRMGVPPPVVEHPEHEVRLTDTDPRTYWTTGPGGDRDAFARAFDQARTGHAEVEPEHPSDWPYDRCESCGHEITNRYETRPGGCAYCKPDPEETPVPERMIVHQPGDKFATMTAEGVSRVWEVAEQGGVKPEGGLGRLLIDAVVEAVKHLPGAEDKDGKGEPDKDSPYDDPRAPAEEPDGALRRAYANGYERAERAMLRAVEEIKTWAMPYGGRTEDIAQAYDRIVSHIVTSVRDEGTRAVHEGEGIRASGVGLHSAILLGLDESNPGIPLSRRRRVSDAIQRRIEPEIAQAVRRALGDAENAVAGNCRQAHPGQQTGLCQACADAVAILRTHRTAH